jgi:hypothetical protein
MSDSSNNPKDFLVSPVSVKIHQDWSEVIERAQNLIKHAKTKNTRVEPDGNATFYHIGSLGSVSHHHISENWHQVVGPWTYKHLPWLPCLMKDMAELDPRYAISIMVGDGAEHVDFVDAPTAFNYPITTTDAFTYVNYQGQEYTYPSIAGQPWILNTQYPHGVRNNELRLVFNLHFGQSYQQVKKWFDQHPNLVYN